MMKSAPIGVAVREAGIQLELVLLNNRQRRHMRRLLRLSEDNPVHQILTISLRDSDRVVKPGKQPENDQEWMQDQKVRNLGQTLANSLVMPADLDASLGIESTATVLDVGFPGKIEILGNKNLEIHEARLYEQLRLELSL